MFGYFQGNTPDLWTTDPELIKSVLVKDFPCFINRRVSVKLLCCYRDYICLINAVVLGDIASD